MNKKEITVIKKKSAESYAKYHESGSPYMDYDLKTSIAYAGKQLPSVLEGNIRIKELLESDKPVMIARLGGNETGAMALGDLESFPVYSPFRRHRLKVALDCFFHSAGYFPYDINTTPRFAKLMQDSCRQLDMLGVWFNQYEDYIIERYAPQTEICRLRAIEPYFSMSQPWTQALKGKKVLVIHPFAETIEQQYKFREKLFPNKEVLPEFELLTLKAVQTIAGENQDQFADWYAALDYMYEQTLQYDYDIAIVGCGAYGFPLAAKIKAGEKKVVHMGGATQILFGIKGKRWEKHNVISQLFNEYWTYPSKKETPANLSKIEDNGCYW